MLNSICRIEEIPFLNRSVLFYNMERDVEPGLRKIMDELTLHSHILPDKGTLEYYRIGTKRTSFIFDASNGERVEYYQKNTRHNSIPRVKEFLNKCKFTVTSVLGVAYDVIVYSEGYAFRFLNENHALRFKKRLDTNPAIASAMVDEFVRNAGESGRLFFKEGGTIVNHLHLPDRPAGASGIQLIKLGPKNSKVVSSVKPEVWIPSINQFVTVKGSTEVYAIKNYNPHTRTFVLSNTHTSIRRTACIDIVTPLKVIR